MEFHHILDREPEDNTVIVQIHKPFNMYNGDFKKHYIMGMREYHRICSMDDLVAAGFPKPDFWWIDAKDFMFPDQPERLSEKTSSDRGCDSLNSTDKVEK